MNYLNLVYGKDNIHTYIPDYYALFLVRNTYTSCILLQYLYCVLKFSLTPTPEYTAVQY